MAAGDTRQLDAGKTLDALRQRFLRDVVDLIPNPVFFRDADGRYQGCNRAFESLIGRPGHEIVGRRVSDIAPAELAEHSLEMDRRLLRRGGIQVYEHQVQTAAGEIRDVIFHKTLLEDDSGRPIGLMGTATDITTQRRTERRLQESEHRFRDLFESAPVGIFQSTTDGRVLRVNQAYAAIFGYDSPEAAVKNIRDVGRDIYVYPEQRPKLIELVRRQNRLMNFEVEYRRADGSIFVGNLHLRMVPASDERPEYLEGFVSDATDRKQAEQRIKATAAKYESLFNNAQVGLFRSRIEDGLCLEANNRLAEMLGYDSRDQMIGRFHFGKAYVDPQRRKDMLALLMETGEISHYDAELYRRDGSIIYVRYTGRVFPEEGFIEGVMADVTEEKKAEAEMLASQERYRVLAENVADGVVLVKDGLVAADNQPFRQLFELIYGTGASPVGRELAELWPPQERPEVRDRLSEALAGLSGGRSLRSRISPDGPEIWIEASMHPVRFQAGPAVLVTVRNVTQQVRRELEIEEEVQRLKNENVKLRSSVRDRYRLGEIIGKSPAMQEVYELVLRAAGTDAHVIVSGESGTGKDLVARAIHNLSDRKNADFVPVNCGAIPENLLESEFFGYKKGAFTGASYDKHGYLDLADGGTLFLDEIGELSLNLQVKLLRAVEGGGYTPLGGRDVRKPDVRVIAASNRDLAEEVRAGRMREDFYYRIHVIPINLPPLRKRKEDLPLLIEHFLDQSGDEAAAPPAAVIERLHQYHWPGNVRELQNVLQRYLALGALDFLDRPEGPRTPPADESQITVDPAGRRPLKTAVEDFERSYIRAVLERCRWNRTRAAESLGVSRRTLHRRLRDLGID